MRDVVRAVGVLLDGAAGLVWFDGEVPDSAPERYVCLYVTTPRQEGERLSADHSQRVYTVSTMSVGTSPNECRWVAEKVHAALTRVRPAVEGRMCSPIRLLTAGQVRDDDSINPPAWIATDVWRFSVTA